MIEIKANDFGTNYEIFDYLRRNVVEYDNVTIDLCPYWIVNVQNGNAIESVDTRLDTHQTFPELFKEMKQFRCDRYSLIDDYLNDVISIISILKFKHCVYKLYNTEHTNNNVDLHETGISLSKIKYVERNFAHV